LLDPFVEKFFNIPDFPFDRLGQVGAVDLDPELVVELRTAEEIRAGDE
jgi:hypothetical protein